MEWGALIIFFLVYLGMILGSWPGLAIDRTGIALLGAIAFMELQNLSITQMTGMLDLASLTMLFSFMIISAQFYFSGFYTFIVNRMEKWEISPSFLLFVVISVSAFLSAILINDIVCLALTPLIIKGCYHKKLNPVPFLLALACASNIGSAITLIGNPQNILIGQNLNIPFGHYLKYSLVPCLLGGLACGFIICKQTKKWHQKEHPDVNFEVISFDSWQSLKGIIVISVLLILFFFSNIPREKISLVGAGFLLLSRRMASQTMLSFIDWQLLVLFIGLFIVNGSFLKTDVWNTFVHYIEGYGINLQSPAWIFTLSVLLSNIVSNVPAVMLMLPFVENEFAGALLALSSTLAGNLLIIGSIANLIVISQAAPFGIKIHWKDHAKVGIPVTLISLACAALWLYLIS